MRIPETIKIGGKDFKIEYDPAVITDEGYACRGRSRAAMQLIQLIQLNPSFPQQTIDCTLLHEILEALNTNSEIGLEHKQISQLEECLYQILKDNKLHFDEE